MSNCETCMVQFDHSKHKPHMLACPHTFCLSCVKKLTIKKCPTCNETFTKTNLNLALLKLISKSSSDELKDQKIKELNEIKNNLKNSCQDKLTFYEAKLASIDQTITNETKKAISILKENEQLLKNECKSLFQKIKHDLDIDLFISKENIQKDELNEESLYNLNKQLENIKNYEIKFGFNQRSFENVKSSIKSSLENIQEKITNHWIQCLAVLPDGSLACGCSDGKIIIMDIKSGNKIKTLTDHTIIVTCLAVLPDGSLASGCIEGKVIKWTICKNGSHIYGYTSSVLCLVYLPDGSLASGCHDGKIRIWEIESGDKIKTLNAHLNDVTCLVVLPDGTLASGSKDQEIIIWNIKSGNEIKRLFCQSGSVNCLVVLPDGSLASGNDGGEIIIWNTKNGKEINTLSGDVNFLAVLPDGSLACGCSDGKIIIWNIKSGNKIKTLYGHTDDVSCLVVLPDGSLASGSHDGKIIIWNISSGNKIQAFYANNLIVKWFN